MSYTNFRDGYKKETTPGTSIVTDPAHDCNVFGAYSPESDWPSPVALTRYTATGYNVKEVGAGLAWKSHYIVAGMLGMVMQNGIICWATMGKSSTAGADPYTHTITPTTDGSPLPSFTLNHEQKGGATDEEYQFMGCKIDSLAMTYDMSDTPFLMAFAEIRGMGAQDGQDLTNDPALPATVNTDAYVELERVWDVGSAHGGPLDIDGLQRVEINIANGLRPIYGKTYDTGTYTGQWPFMLAEAKRKEYRVRMLLHPNTIERDMWDSLISTTTAITSTFKFIRGANDYIEVTAVGPVVTHEIKTPKTGEVLLEEVIIEPYSLSIEVKDSIAGATNYGE